MLENGRPARPPVFIKNERLVIDPAYEKYLGLILLDPSEPPMVWEVGRSDRLYRNEGPGPDGLPRFTDVSQAAGIEDRDHALSCLWTDPNEDGYPDLFVANDYIEADRFYANNHDGTFREVSRAALGHTAWFSMCCRWPALFCLDEHCSLGQFICPIGQERFRSPFRQLLS